MHIEPGLVDSAKIALSYATGADNQDILLHLTQKPPWTLIGVGEIVSLNNQDKLCL